MINKKLSKYVMTALLSSFVMVAHAQSKNTTTHNETKIEGKSNLTFKNDEQKMSYIIAKQIAASIQNDGLKIDRTTFLKALSEGLDGKSSELSAKESQVFMQKYLMAQQKERGEENAKEGEKFLAKNKKENNVVTLPSGLQYKIVTEGTGAKPKVTDTVTVDYQGTLVNGKVFDSSYERGQPVSFPVNGVIKGWTEALQLMPEGSTWMLYIPASLAYGEQAPSALIGPKSTLIFKVHLISISKPKTAQATQNSNKLDETKKVQ